MTEKQRKYLRQLINKLEKYTDCYENINEAPKDIELKIEYLIQTIAVFERLHCPIGELEEKYSEITKKLFEL